MIFLIDELTELPTELDRSFINYVTRRTY